MAGAQEAMSYGEAEHGGLAHVSILVISKATALTRPAVGNGHSAELEVRGKLGGASIEFLETHVEAVDEEQRLVIRAVTRARAEPGSLLELLLDHRLQRGDADVLLDVSPESR